MGKKIVDLRTINLNTGKAPTFMDSFGRSFLYFLFVIYLVIPALLSGLAVLWTTCKQTWHDTAFNIAVITNSPTKEIKTPEGFKQNSILKHADKLRELKQLQEQGIISNEEFESEKERYWTLIIKSDKSNQSIPQQSYPFRELCAFSKLQRLS
ncbi:MAG: RDD family protein [Cyclobacteriaceae bacterium]|nr:MAG: RDD family protein [Cyclobacteriaceae bacterium]